MVGAAEPGLEIREDGMAGALPAGLDEIVCAAGEARKLLGEAVERLGLSARAARRALRGARTNPDPAGETHVGVAEIAESLGYGGTRAGGAPSQDRHSG